MSRYRAIAATTGEWMERLNVSPTSLLNWLLTRNECECYRDIADVLQLYLVDLPEEVEEWETDLGMDYGYQPDLSLRVDGASCMVVDSNTHHVIGAFCIPEWLVDLNWIFLFKSQVDQSPLYRDEIYNYLLIRWKIDEPEDAANVKLKIVDLLP